MWDYSVCIQIRGSKGGHIFLGVRGFWYIIAQARGWTMVETMDMDAAHPAGKNEYNVKWQVLQDEPNKAHKTATCLRSPSQWAAEAPASSAHSCLSASQPSVQFNHNSAVHCPSSASLSWPQQSTSSQGSWVALRTLTRKVWNTPFLQPLGPCESQVKMKRINVLLGLRWSTLWGLRQRETKQNNLSDCTIESNSWGNNCKHFPGQHTLRLHSAIAPKAPQVPGARQCALGMHFPSILISFSMR